MIVKCLRCKSDMEKQLKGQISERALGMHCVYVEVLFCTKCDYIELSQK